MAAVGSAISNVARRDPLPIRLPEELFQLESQAEPILLAKARRLHAGGALFLDARGRDAYVEGRIQGAFHLPYEGWEDSYEQVEPWLTEALVVVYSAEEEVGMADGLAELLADRGDQEQVFVFLEGFERWEESGGPIDSGADPFEADEGLDLDEEFEE